MSRKTIEVRQLEVRSRLRDLAGPDDLDDEQRVELRSLTAEAKDLDAKLAGLIASEPEPEEVLVAGNDEREWIELRSRANVGDVFTAAMQKGPSVGAVAEMQQELGMGPHDVPLELIEERASASLPTAASHDVTQAVQRPTLQPVFPTPTSEMMNVMRQRVPAGQAMYPVISAPSTGSGETARATDTGDTTFTVGAAPLKPARIQANISYAVEDAAIFPSLDADIRRTLNGAISSGLDRQALTLTGQGLLDHGTDPTADGTTETFALYQAAMFGQVDGRYADTIAGVKLLVGAATYAQMGAVYRGSQQIESALEWAMRNIGWIGVSAYVPGAASGVQQAVFCRGPMGAAVQPVWPAIAIQVDPYSDSDAGEVKLTARALATFRVLRADQYVRQAFDIS